MGNLIGQLTISKVSERDVEVVLSVDLKKRILSVHSLQSSKLTLSILIASTVIKYEMNSDQGIHFWNYFRGDISVRSVSCRLKY